MVRDMFSSIHWTESNVSETIPLAYTVSEAVKTTGLARTRLYELAGQGRITFRRAGRRTVILADDLRTLLASLPPAPIRQKSA
jgi:excisionase family DNA binding protein